MAQTSLRHVLIVDQREAERSAKSDVLRKVGLGVIEADDDVSAINALQEHFSEIKVVVLSAALPDTPTNKVLQWIGQNRPAVPVMRPAATLMPPPEAADRSANVGLGEPAHEAEFVSQVQTVLRMQDAGEALQISQDAEWQSAAELAAIYIQAPIGLAVISVDKRFLLINERLAEINGLPARDHIGRTIREVVPALAAQAEDLIDRIFATGEPVLDIEIEGETPADPNARRTWLEHWQPIKDAFGTVTAVNIVAEEITEKKRHEQQLRDSEQKLKAVLDVLPVGVGLTETNGKVTLSNAMFRQYVPEYIPSRDEGSRDLWLGHDAEGRLIGPENYSGARALRGESVVPGTDFLFHPPNAAPVWTRVAAVPLRSDSGEILGAIAVISDIDREQRALEAIRESEARYRQLFEMNPLPMLIFDTETLSVLKINTAALELYGYTREEFAKLTLKDIHPLEDIAPFQKYLARHAGETLVHDNIWRHRKKDCTIFDVEITSHELEYNSRPARFVMVQDITERRRTEEHNRMLMYEVNHRSKNLLAVVQSIANQTINKGDPRTFALRFSERLQGLAASHDLLVHNKWQGVDLADLIASQLAPFRNALKDRITVEGPKLHINVTTAQSLGLALHELATNAGKCGALSNGEGEVKISWQVNRTATTHLFRMTWVESGGPEVKAPTRKGFGTVLLADMIRTSLHGNVQLDYAPSGFTWLLEAPVENTVDDGAATKSEID